MNKEQAKEKIKGLVEEYNDLRLSDGLKDKNEAFVKQRFVQPMFEALGWNFRQDVWPEEKVSQGRVDFAFMLGDFPKFFVEAKKFSVNLDDEQWAKQTIDYAYNRSVTWAVLTNFKSLKIFNSEWNKKPYRAIKEFSCENYLERFDELWYLSKQSISQGELDKKAEEWGVVEKKVPVTEQLAKDMREWRDSLTIEVREWNKEKFKEEEIDEAVQRFLDRLIFIRYAEDKGLEPKILEPLVRGNKDSVENLIAKLNKIFRQFDKWYDSRLFEPHFSEEMEVYSGKLEKIVLGLYRSAKTGHPYDFSAISADVLGAVYEQYLGYLQKKQKENKNAKRKEQGIYYTPIFIVDYIVQNTLGAVLKEKSPEQIRDIKILDPACGSGSFLIKAYQTLIDYYENPKNIRIDTASQIGKVQKIMLEKKGKNELSAGQKTKLLRENIYGVDLDPKAVEIAQLNLLLKAIIPRTKLPNLSHNIACGNSLVEASEEKYKPFNWRAEFKEVFAQGGFDVVIGNPPYVFARGGSFNETEKKYYYENYKLQQYQINTFILFIERGFSLLKEGGYLGFIVPNNWLTINSAAKIREHLLKNVGDFKIINAVDTVFSQASVDTCILLFRKIKPTKVELGELKDGEITALKKFKPEDFYGNDFVINIARLKGAKNNKILGKLNSYKVLSDIAKVSTGLKAYQIGKGKPVQTKEIKESRKFHSKKGLDKTYIPYLDGVDVRRYKMDWSGEYLSYGDWLAEPRKSVPFDGPRILVRQIPAQPPYCINGVFTDEKYLNDINSMVIFNPIKGYDLKYILGVINSRFLSYWFISTFDKFQRKIFPQFKVNELARFPIYPADKNQQKAVIGLVNKIIELNIKLREATENSDQWRKIKEEIEKTDKEIDKKVYELYGLGEEERKIMQ